MRKEWGLATLLGLAMIWANWSTLGDLVARWWDDSRYSHGFLVPAFSAFLLHRRRGMLAGRALRPSWAGLVAVVLGVGLGLAGQRYYYQGIAAASLILSLTGLVLLLGGVPLLRWAWPAIAYLIFMIPLPWRLEIGLGEPLRQAATAMSTYALQTLGQPAYAEGNIIHIGDAKIGVVDACNGLGMMMMFFAFATAMALLSRQGPVHKAILILSAPAIAILVNVARIAATGLLHRYAGSALADRFYHDLAGLLMMPLALAALWAEAELLSRLLIEEVEVRSESKGPELRLLLRDSLGVVSGPAAVPSGQRRA